MRKAKKLFKNVLSPYSLFSQIGYKIKQIWGINALIRNNLARSYNEETCQVLKLGRSKTTVLT